MCGTRLLRRPSPPSGPAASPPARGSDTRGPSLDGQARRRQSPRAQRPHWPQAGWPTPGSPSWLDLPGSPSPLTTLVFGAATHVPRAVHERLVQLGLLPLGGQRPSAPRVRRPSPAVSSLPPGALSCQSSPCSGRESAAGRGWQACEPGGPLAPCELSHPPSRMPMWLPSVLSRASGLSCHSEHPLATSARAPCMAAGPGPCLAHTLPFLLTS